MRVLDIDPFSEILKRFRKIVTITDLIVEIPNSLPIGSAISCATALLDVFSGCPTRNPRAINSSASGNCWINARV